MAEPSAFPSTFAQWQRQAQTTLKLAEAKGQRVERVEMAAPSFRDFCRVRNLAHDLRARAL